MEIAIILIAALVAYVFIVKATVKNFNRAETTTQRIFWAMLLLFTLSFFFTGNDSNANEGGNNYGADEEEQGFSLFGSDDEDWLDSGMDDGFDDD